MKDCGHSRRRDFYKRVRLYCGYCGKVRRWTREEIARADERAKEFEWMLTDTHSAGEHDQEGR